MVRRIAALPVQSLSSASAGGPDLGPFGGRLAGYQDF